MILEDFIRLLYSYYVSTNKYWFTLEELLIWALQRGYRFTARSLENKLEHAARKGFLRKVYAKYTNEWGLPVKRRRYQLNLREIRRVALRR